MTTFNLKIFKAIEHATILYKGNYRKSTGADAILHPYGVMSILKHYGYNEEVQIAGLMHDVIEDCKHTNYTIEDMEKDYGKNVAQYVIDLSEPDKSLSWAERKIEHVNRIADCSYESKAIECADKINNLYGIVDSLKTDKNTWNNFNASKENIAWYYIAMYKACIKGYEDQNIHIFNDLKSLIAKMDFEKIAIAPKI